jgi:cation diffusion facilitator family transporter
MADPSNAAELERHSHGHDHEHAHEHEHDHGRAVPDASGAVIGAFTPGEARQARRLAIVLALVSGFFVVELGGALVAGSVVLQADALHLLMDVLAIAVSLFAMRLAVRRPTPRYTFGLRRAEPVAAIFSAFVVLATTAGIVFEGIEALHQRTPPRTGIMLAVAIVALFVNGTSAWLLHDAIGHGHSHAHDPDNPDDHDDEHDHDHDHPPRPGGHSLNLRGAWLHLLGDTLGAVAALVAALFIRFGGHPAADPIASFVVAAILLYGSLRLLRDATGVLLEAAPPHLPVEAIHRVVATFPGVSSVHDLHVWTLGAGHDAVTVHVVTAEHDPSLGQRLSERIRSMLRVEYVTVQVEVEGDSCGPARPRA